MERRDSLKSWQEIILETISFKDLIMFLFQSERNKCLEPIYLSSMTEVNCISLKLIDFASRCRNEDIRNKLLLITSNLNRSHEERFTALHYACHLGCTEIVETLIQTGVDINAKNAQEITALHLASTRQHQNIVELLIENGANLNIQNAGGSYAITLAAFRVSSGCLNALITAGSDLNLQDKIGDTALHIACYRKDEVKVKALIEAGANVNIANECGCTPLHLLLPSINDLSRALLYPVKKYTTKCNLSEDPLVVNKIADYLISANIDIKLKDKHGNTALHQAVMIPRNIELIKKLIELGAGVNEQNENGETAMHFACMVNERQTIEVLKDAGADVNTQSKYGDQALHYAVSFGSNESVKELIKSGVEINRQNNVGVTALHLICMTHNLEIFETLLIRGAKAELKDHNGRDLLSYVDSAVGMLIVFKMHRFFTLYRDVFGNTIFHLLIKAAFYASDETIWSFIRTRRKGLSYFLSIKNMFGQTPLHIAASTNQSILVLIFSTFDEDLHDLLLRDEYGNTFLHELIKSNFSMQNYHREGFDMSFLRRLLENEYQNCPVQTRTYLIQSRNSVGNTALHLVFKDALMNRNSEYAESVFELFLKAGANVNDSNNFGESILHLVMFTFRSYPELAKTVVENGAEVNIRNTFGESVIFIVPLRELPDTENSISDTDYLEFLKRSGCDTNICNRIGQTAVMAHFKDIFFNLNAFDKVFDNKAIVNMQDNFGSTLLHYIAWEEENERFINTNILKKDIVAFSKCSVMKDQQGQLPCDVAFLRGHANILNQICVCKNGVHKNESVFHHRHLLFNSLKEKDISYTNCVESLSKHCLEDNIRNMIDVPFLGLVNFNKEVNKRVKSAIINMVNYICKKLGEKDELLKNTVILSGSVAENAKVGIPDEFDFMCLLDEISDVLDTDVYNNSDIHIKLKEQYGGDVCSQYFDSNNNFIASKLISRIFDIINEVLQEPETFTCTNIFAVKNGFRKPNASPNFKLKLRWCCSTYKDMTVKVDIVPAFTIRWHRNAELYSDRFNVIANKTDFVYVLFKEREAPKGYRSMSIAPSVSAYLQEKHLFAALTAEAKDAYVISKILCGERTCPSVLDVEIEQNSCKNYKKSQCFAIISSYMLKNCLFHVVEDLQKKSDSHLSVTVHNYVCKIFQKLLEFVKQGIFPCYMFPGIDLFAYKMERENQARMVRAMYAKLILNILGKNLDFDDITLEVSNEFKELPMLDIITNNNICANCKKSPEKDGVTLKTCPKCKLWTYCSDECKERNFARHQPACDYYFGKLS